MWELIGAVIGGAATVGVPLVGWVLKLQGRLVALETWREIYEDHFERFESRILQVLDRIERKLDGKVDK